MALTDDGRPICGSCSATRPARRTLATDGTDPRVDAFGTRALTPAEQDHTAAAGTRIPNAAVRAAAGQPSPDTCPALSFLRVCSVYQARPMICRLWGATEQLPCPHGCQPEGGRLPDEQAKSLLRAATELSRQQRERHRP